ncbi:hypothetical protein RYX36_020803 [Vicia faba]
MAPPAEHSGDSSTGESQRSTPTPFITKTYQIVDDRTIDDVVSWNETGTSFVVWNPAGFKKVVPDRWEFSNEFFRRGEKRLLRDIQRRKILSKSPSAVINSSATATVAVVSSPLHSAKPIVSPSISGEEQVISSDSSPFEQATLLEENKRLRKENMQLTTEIEDMKSLFNNIFNLMSNYAKFQGKKCCSTATNTVSISPGKRYGVEDAAEMVVDDNYPKLFGVAIGKKRAREEGKYVEDNTVFSLNQFDLQNCVKRNTMC